MKNEYLPVKVIIEKIINESQDSKTFILQPQDKNNGILRYKPGQFLILSLPGYGEAPFTYASCSNKDGRIQISVRRVGSLTEALHKLKEKDVLGARGPYGNTFPLDKIEKKDLLFVAGGCGIAPLRSLIQHVFKNRKVHGNIEIIYGCRTPKDMFYKEEIQSWRGNCDTNIHLTVDEPDASWGGSCGVVCVLFPKINLSPKKTMVFLCGPAVMIKFAIADILKLGFKENNIYDSLERHMKYVCVDGPNFSYVQMKELGIES
jgi:NAD(P)H-flavin reductase